MKPTKTALVKLLSAGLLAGSFATTVQAVDVIKADNTDNLNLGTSWIGGSTPTSVDVGVWNNTVAVNTTSSLGADTNWAGIRIADPAGTITINAGNILTLGGSGIDMSAASQDLTLNNSNVIGASQTWNVAAGRTLTASQPLSGPTASVLTKSGAGTLNLSSTVNGLFSGNVSIDGGLLHLNSANGNNNSAAGAGFITNNSSVLQGFNRIIGNTLIFNGTCLIDANNTSQVLDGAWMGAGTVIVSNLISGQTLTAGGNGNNSGNWAGFTGTVLLGPSTGNFRLNNGGGNSNLGNPSCTIDLGSGACTLTTRNRLGSTINVGVLTGGSSTRITIGSNGTGATTWAIGAKNVACQFDGILTGDSASNPLQLNKVGTNVFTLTGPNNNVGVTTVTAGTLQIGNGGTTGQLGTGNVVNNASLLFNRADDVAVPNNVSGSGTLIQSTVTTLTLNGAVSCSILISQGAVAVGGSGTITGPINVTSGAVFNVTNNLTYVLTTPLSGNGSVTGTLTAGSGASIRPGGSGAPGTLTFSNGLTETGGAANSFDLSDDPTGLIKTNDLIVIVGDLNLSGANSVVFNPLNSSIPSGTYKLFQYSGNLVGNLSSLTTGNPYYVLTNPPGEIDVIISGTRAPANLVWVGNPLTNNWDEGITTNWLNGSVLDVFFTLDVVTFNGTGAANPNVNLVGVLQPKSVVVNAATDYLFTGTGDLDGSSSLTKTNSGTLTIGTTNSYSGPTIVGGGTLAVSNLVVGAVPSSIGAASGDPTNLVFFGTTLRYLGGSTTTDRGATLNGAGATIEVTDPSVTLGTIGQLTGPGALTKTGGGQLDVNAANNFVGGTLVQGGTIRMLNTAGFGTNIITLDGETNGATFLFGADTQTLPNALNVVGTNNFVVNRGNNTLSVINGSGTFTVNLGTSGNTMSLGGNMTAFSGTIIANLPFLRFNGATGSTNATFDVGTGTSTLQNRNGGTFQLGALAGGSTTILSGKSTSGSGSSTYVIGTHPTKPNSTFDGVIADGIGGATAVTKVGPGTLTLSGASTHTGTTTVSNGVLALVFNGSADGSIANSGVINVVSGAFLDVSGRSDQTLLLGSQELRGRGTILGSVNANGTGTVAPGGGPNGNTGTLTVTNNVFLSGTAWMKLNRDNVPNSDLLVSTLGTINFGGTLVATNVGARLQIGDTFNLFDGGLAGSFTTLSLANYYTWDTSNLGVNGTISVTGILPGPNVDSISVSGGNVTLTATNGAPGGMYVVVTSTNATLPITSWTPVSTNNFDGTGVINPPLVIPTDPSAAQQYYLLEVF